MDVKHLSRPVLILIRGLPGSGKSYLAASLQQAIQADVIALDPDATDYHSQAYKDHVASLNAEGVDPSLHAYRFLRAQAYAGIAANKVILWNQPFTNRETFQKVIARLQEFAASVPTDLDILIVEVGVDPAAAKARVDARKQAGGHGPSDATFTEFTEDYTSFADEGLPIVAVDGNKDVTYGIRKIITALHKLIVIS